MRGGRRGVEARARRRTTISIDDIDLVSLTAYRDGPPFAAFARLRAEDPVHWHPEARGPGFWAVTRHAEVVEVSRDSATFSSERGGTMLATPEPVELMGIQQMLLNMDPPRHTRLRALVNKGFTPRRVAELGQRVSELTSQIVESAAGRGAFDFVTSVAGELPSFMIAHLMGIPLEDGRELYRLTERMHASDPDDPLNLDVRTAMGEMMNYSARLRTEKEKDPGRDLASTLLAAEIDGERLTEFEFHMFFLLLINAGGDTTRNLVAGGMQALFEHPEQYARLRADPGLLDVAIEEMLRWVTPVIHFRRTATRDCVIAGQAIREGDKVVVFYSSANRDEAVFADPDRFDVGRTPNEHVAFGGGGTHFCLGANLARLETRTLLSRILDRMPGLRLAGPVERLSSNFINGPRRMPVEIV